MPIRPREYEARPYVRPAYEPDTRTLLEIMRMAGQARSSAIGRRGQAKAEGLITLGQVISGALQSQRVGRERQQLAEMEMAEKQAARAQDETFRRDQLGALTEEREANRTMREDAAAQAARDRAEKAAIRFGAETPPGPISEQGLAVAAADPATFARTRYSFGPGTAEGPELQPTPQQAEMAKFRETVAGQGGTVSPTGSVFVPPKPAQEPLELMAARGDKMAQRALQIKRSMQAPLAPVVVQTPEGPAVLNRGTLTAEPITMGGKTVGVTPSASERMDARKFSKAAPVLNGIGELSERINTLQGVVAKATGEVERQKAKLNLNDDVAEYEALVSGFTPLIARALGHTGVLTQQDVDSVKALFPRPGDSKTLRDRKVTRMMGIIGDLQQMDGAPKSAPLDTVQPGDIEYDMNGKPIPKGKP